MRHLLIVSLLFILSAIALLMTPVYQFYAHRGDLPMPFWSRITIPDSAPKFSQSIHSGYQSIAREAAEMLEQHRQKINSPGISAAVAIDGQWVWSGGSGWANLTTLQPIKVDTQFRIGSTSKALTATLLARLVQNQKIRLDTPLKDLNVGQRNAKWAKITPRNLASHTSGLPHYGGNTEWYGLYQFMTLDTHYDAVTEAVTLFDESELLFTPGESFHYSSLGTVLLSAALEDVGEQSFQSLMYDKVLSPLGMKHTKPEPANNRKASQLAEFYWRDDESKPIVRRWRNVDLSHRLAGGGFISTPGDLVKLGLGFIDNGFIRADLREEFWTPQRLNNGEINEQRYAIGWRVQSLDLGDALGEPMVAHHGGVSRGSQSWLMVIPEHRMVVAVTINTKTEVFWDFAKISKPLAQLFLTRRQAGQP